MDLIYRKFTHSSMHAIASYQMYAMYRKIYQGSGYKLWTGGRRVYSLCLHGDCNLVQ